LCKRQWRNQSADQSNNCSFHSDASLLVRFTSTVRGSGLERTLLVRNLFTRLVLRRFGLLLTSAI
jgi:hypothetical protein